MWQHLSTSDIIFLPEEEAVLQTVHLFLLGRAIMRAAFEYSSSRSCEEEGSVALSVLNITLTTE